jgi:hypothetical protein
MYNSFDSNDITFHHSNKHGLFFWCGEMEGCLVDYVAKKNLQIYCLTAGGRP